MVPQILFILQYECITLNSPNDNCQSANLRAHALLVQLRLSPNQADEEVTVRGNGNHLESILFHIPFFHILERNFFSFDD